MAEKTPEHPQSNEIDEARKAQRERHLKTIPGTMPSFTLDAFGGLGPANTSELINTQRSRITPPSLNRAQPPSIKVSPQTSPRPLTPPTSAPPLLHKSEMNALSIPGGTAEESLTPSITGEFFTNELLCERYQLLKKIGQGGMGAVFLATDTRLNREVVVKVSHGKGNGPSREDKARFEREALKMASLNHPNIVTIYDYGTHIGDQFLVMEHVKGETLKAFINHPSQISLTLFRDIIKQLLRGVQDAHLNDVIHRDLKPSNIMWDGEKKVLKILDFGLARGVEGDTVTGTGHVHGSIQYMAPEQIRGEAQGPATDIYAIGILCFQLLSKSLPFRGDNTVELMFQKLQRDPYQLLDQQGIPTWVSADLAKVIHSCLKLKSSERPQSATTCLQQLLQTLPHESLASETSELDFGTAQSTSIVDKSLDDLLPKSQVITSPALSAKPLMLGLIALNIGVWFIFSLFTTEEKTTKISTTALIHFSALDPLTGAESEVQLSVGGRLRGTTPLRLELPLGRHEVLLKRDDWSYSKTYDLKDGGTYWYHLPAPPMSIVEIPQPAILDRDSDLGSRQQILEPELEIPRPGVEIDQQNSAPKPAFSQPSSRTARKKKRKSINRRKSVRTKKKLRQSPKPTVAPAKPQKTVRPKPTPPKTATQKTTIDVPLLED